MLFKQIDLEKIAAGRVDRAYRRWKRPTVRAGGTLKTPIGVLQIEAVDPISPEEIREPDAIRAGYASRQALFEELDQRGNGDLYRIRFHLAGEDPRIALRAADDLSLEDLALLDTRLARLDQANRPGPWTQAFLKLIEQQPGKRAGDLAALAGFEKEEFKINVRKLKNLGLTESLEIGYRISPRGKAYLKHRGKKTSKRSVK